MYVLKDRFTSRDGVMADDPRPWGMKQEWLDKYGAMLPPDKGCAICILVHLEGGLADEVVFMTEAGYSETHKVDAGGWAHSTMYNPGSGYNDDNKKGPWRVAALHHPSVVVDDIGLPKGEHVSHFILLGWEEGTVETPDDGPDPVDPTDPPDSPGETLADYPVHIKVEAGGFNFVGWAKIVP